MRSPLEAHLRVGAVFQMRPPITPWEGTGCQSPRCAAGLNAVARRICQPPDDRRPTPQFWPRRTNVWRRAANPARGSKRLNSGTRLFRCWTNRTDTSPKTWITTMLKTITAGLLALLAWTTTPASAASLKYKACDDGKAGCYVITIAGEITKDDGKDLADFVASK